jgi:MerR family transcriptional regulator, light-induced transcriptional regulator
MNTSGDLTIRELAERTGVASATLRSWESRYGAPRPRRLPGGHRRYSDQDVALVAEVLRLRDSGLGLPTAIAQAAARTTSAAAVDPAVFAGLRRRHPHLASRALHKRTVLALTRAMEDECVARAEHPLLFACFQRERFYLESRARWEDLARTAEDVVVFADFSDLGNGPGRPLRVQLPDDAPLRREWLLVCDSPDYPACVAGWELPGQDDVPDTARRFETLWTVDPVEVRDAARICAGLADRYSGSADPSWAERLDERLAGTPTQASPDLRRAQDLLSRMVGYLDDTLRTRTVS